MTDVSDRATRSRVMRAVRSRNTRPERRLFMALVRAGLRFRKWPKAAGSPDALVEGRVAVWVHGCFWHGCPAHYRAPKSNRRFWRSKIWRNSLRDARDIAAAVLDGYRPLVLWECRLDLVAADPKRFFAEKMR